MRTALLFLLIAAQSTLAQGADKPVVRTTPPPPDPHLLRQGGDTIETAIAITYHGGPYVGTTTGYTDDYDETCPYDGSTSPDVVYSLAAGGAAYETWIFDLAGSSYDTKIYIYDSSGGLVACNDDGNPDDTSRLDVCFYDADTYFLVIDGYGGDHGDYILDVTLLVGALVDCGWFYWPEGEVLEDGALDTFNCGCDCDDQVPRVLELAAESDGTKDMCGQLGWTTVADELRYDTDWFEIRVGASGTVEGQIVSTHAFVLPVYLAGACDQLALLQYVVVPPAALAEFTIAAEPGQAVWLVPNTPHFDPPCGGVTPQTFDYELHLWGLEAPVAVEGRSWSAVKRLYR